MSTLEEETQAEVLADEEATGASLTTPARLTAYVRGGAGVLVPNGTRASWLPTWKNQLMPVPLKTAW